MIRVILIRPGTTDYDEQRRIKGTLDIPLNEFGNDLCLETRILVPTLRVGMQSGRFASLGITRRMKLKSGA